MRAKATTKTIKKTNHKIYYMFSLEEFFLFKCNVWEVPAKRNQNEERQQRKKKNRCRIFLYFLYNFVQVFVFFAKGIL